VNAGAAGRKQIFGANNSVALKKLQLEALGKKKWEFSYVRHVLVEPFLKMHEAPQDVFEAYPDADREMYYKMANNNTGEYVMWNNMANIMVGDGLFTDAIDCLEIAALQLFNLFNTMKSAPGSPSRSPTRGGQTLTAEGRYWQREWAEVRLNIAYVHEVLGDAEHVYHVLSEKSDFGVLATEVSPFPRSEKHVGFRTEKEYSEIYDRARQMLLR